MIVIAGARVLAIAGARHRSVRDRNGAHSALTECGQRTLLAKEGSVSSFGKYTGTSYSNPRWHVETRRPGPGLPDRPQFPMAGLRPDPPSASEAHGQGLSAARQIHVRSRTVRRKCRFRTRL